MSPWQPLNAAGDASVVGTVMFVMSICIMGGLIAILLFGKKIQMGLTKARNKHGELGALITGVLSLAIIEAFLPMQLMKGKVHPGRCIYVLHHRSDPFTDHQAVQMPVAQELCHGKTPCSWAWRPRWSGSGYLVNLGEEHNMDKKYEDSIHRTGRIGIIIGIILMLGIPAVISSVYDVWPESAAQVITAGSGLLAVFIPTCIAEVFSYTPILGSSAYITFLTGNVMNLKVPVVVNAQIMSDTASGTEEGDAVATIGVAVSSIVTTLIIAGGVLLLVPLRPILTSPTVQTATTYLLPALFGGIF